MEYEAVISRILAAEREARDLTRGTREKEARLEEDMARDAERARAECFAWAGQKLEEVRRETEEYKAKSLKAQDAWLAEVMSGVERAYSRYGDNWVDTLFRRIVSGRP